MGVYKGEMDDSNRVRSANIFFDSITFFDAVEQIKVLSQQKSFSYVVTPNIDHMERLTTSKPETQCLHSIYRQAALSLCDSRILDKLLRLKSKRVKEVIPGSSLTAFLFGEVLKEKDKILIVGVEEHYIDRLRDMYPHLDIQHINPSMGFINKPDEVASLVERISEINANYVFFSVGSPRQEILANKLALSGNAGGVGLCVGASVLFIIGAEKRAPVILQKMHLEWVYRIAQNPRRLAIRYFKNFLSLPAIMKSL